MTRTDYADSSYITYVYDSTGKVLSITDSVSGTITYTYSIAGSGMPVGKMISETTPLGSISYTYDSIGRRTSMTVADQPAVNYSYDSDSRLVSVGATPSGRPVSFDIGYDTLGRRTSVVYPNGVTSNFTYDDARDPIRFEGGDVNFYAYVGNNPVNRIDPSGLKTCCDGFPPALPAGWKSCMQEGIASFCQSSQAGYCKIRCLIWGESGDNPNPQGGVPGGGLGQIKWELFESKCKANIKNFDKTKPCDQIKCIAYVLCKEKGGSLARYGTVTRPGSQYQKCMDCCK